MLFTTLIPRSVTRAFMVCSAILCFVTTTLFNYKIWFAVRRHANQIQALQPQKQPIQNGAMTNFAVVKKSALGTFYIYLLFLVCYLPYGFNTMSILINGSSTADNMRFALYSQTLVFLKSSLNPVIYCWKMRHIRHAIMDLLRNIFLYRN